MTESLHFLSNFTELSRSHGVCIEILGSQDRKKNQRSIVSCLASKPRKDTGFPNSWGLQSHSPTTDKQKTAICCARSRSELPAKSRCHWLTDSTEFNKGKMTSRKRKKTLWQLSDNCVFCNYTPLYGKEFSMPV